MSAGTLPDKTPTAAERAAQVAQAYIEPEIEAAEKAARRRALRECYEIAKDFSGQGVIIADLICRRLTA